MCKLCAEKIYAFYEFRQSYVESDKKLREMLHNFEMNQRLNSDSVYSVSNHTNASSSQFEFAKTEVAMTPPSMPVDRFDCHECGKCFDRDLELRIHSHTHRTVDTPSQQNDSQNGFDEQFLMANIKSEPVEYDLDPMEWAEVSQSDVDNLLMGSGDGAGGVGIDNGGNGFGDESNGELRWKCTICQERFLRRAHLRAHRRQHAIDGEHRATKPQNRSLKATNEKKPKDQVQIQIKSIPQINHDNSKISTNVLKKKKQPPMVLPQLSPPAPLPIPIPISMSAALPVLPSILNLTADAQYERWQCKKCGLPFRTRRLLRTHNQCVHRNTSVTSLDFDTSLLSNLSAGDTSSPYQLDVSSFASVTMAEQPMQPNVSPPATVTDVAKKPVQQSPKSHSTPIKSSADARWKCPKCRKVFETPKALRKHKISHHTFEIKLNLKSKNFVSSESANAKKRTANLIGTPRGHVQRDWPCNSCHQVFNRRSLLREHRRTAHMLKPTALPISIMKQEMENFTAEEFTVAN